MADPDHDSSQDERMKAARANIDRLEREAEAERQKASERVGIDREVEREMQTVRPGSDAPPRAGVTPSGSGADGERG